MHDARASDPHCNQHLQSCVQVQRKSTSKLELERYAEGFNMPQFSIQLLVPALRQLDQIINQLKFNILQQDSFSSWDKHWPLTEGVIKGVISLFVVFKKQVHHHHYPSCHNCILNLTFVENLCNSEITCCLDKRPLHII